MRNEASALDTAVETRQRGGRDGHPSKIEPSSFLCDPRAPARRGCGKDEGLRQKDDFILQPFTFIPSSSHPGMRVNRSIDSNRLEST